MPLSECSLEMLRSLGLKSVDDLFTDIPKEVRTDSLRIPDGKPEIDLRRELGEMMAVNKSSDVMPSFLGAGIYDHFIPAAVRMIVSRSEFITSYTPYQPEISQGMLQSLFEYQSFMAELHGDGCRQLEHVRLRDRARRGRSDGPQDLRRGKVPHQQSSQPREEGRRETVREGRGHQARGSRLRPGRRVSSTCLT